MSPKKLLRRVILLFSPARRRHSLVGTAHLWKQKRDFQFHYLKGAGLEPRHYLLDIGCGTLRGGIPLIRHLDEGHYHGIETRAEVLEEGRKELADAGLEGKNPTLIVAEDLRAVDLGRTFDFIWAFSVLFHMTDEILDACLAMVAKHLDAGSFHANVNIGDRAERRWQGFPVVFRSLEFYTEAAERNGMSVWDLGILRDFGHRARIRVQDEQRMLEFRKR